jgi:hypothetical protein
MAKKKAATRSAKKPEQYEAERVKALAREKAQRTKARKIQAEFENAICELPSSASVARELNWIRSHPAMSRHDRKKDDSPIIITPDDILKAPHGRAPSQSAVHQLQHWVNRPQAFYAQMLQEDRKKSKDNAGTTGGDEVPDEIVGIDEMLMLLEGAIDND